jgi:hypothetical protein
MASMGIAIICMQIAALVALVDATQLWSPQRSERPLTQAIFAKSNSSPSPTAAAGFQTRLEALLTRFENHQMARIFITNHGRLDTDLQDNLRETGVLHFLAISAGQLAPVLFAIDLLLKHVIAGVSNRSFGHSPRLRLAAATGVSFGLCLIYGLTGSLMRLLVVDCGRRVFVSAALSYAVRDHSNKTKNTKNNKEGNSTVSQGTVLTLLLVIGAPGTFYALSLVAIFLMGRNLLGDWSFLFACIGALACYLGLLAFTWVPKLSIMRNRFVRATAALFIMQISATIFMMPLTPIGVIPAVTANLLCAPLVSLIIVPPTVLLTLATLCGLTLAGPIGPVLGGASAMADFGLGAFTKITGWLADAWPDPGPPLFAPFSPESYRYVIILVLGSWVLPQIFTLLQWKARIIKLGLTSSEAHLR